MLKLQNILCQHVCKNVNESIYEYMNYARYWVRHVIMCLILSVQDMLITLSCIIPANETEIPTFESIYSYDTVYLSILAYSYSYIRIWKIASLISLSIWYKLTYHAINKKDVKNNQTKQILTNLSKILQALKFCYLV